LLKRTKKVSDCNHIESLCFGLFSLDTVAGSHESTIFFYKVLTVELRLPIQPNLTQSLRTQSPLI